jgi:tRNA threonylcarbamoyladenosine biosynthesis protein TsaB
MVDARKQEVYVAGYRWEDEKLVEVWPPVAIAPEGLASLARGETVLLLGEGARVYHHRLAEALGRKARFGPVDLDVSNASRIARLGACRIEKGLGGDPAGLKPVYGRPSEAELASGRRRRN